MLAGMLRALLSAVVVLSLSGSAWAVPLGYTDKASFDGAVSSLSPPQTLDFEDVASGTLIPSGTGLDGVSFVYSIPGYSLRVSSTFGTTSPSNYLGLDNPDTAFYLGDQITIEFGQVVRAVGLYAIAGSDTQAGDFELSAGGGSVTNAALADRDVSDGSAWFLGLVDTSPGGGFTSATLRGVDAGDGAFLAFSVDDVTTAVPEPGVAALGVSALAVLVAASLWRGRTCTLV